MRKLVLTVLVMRKNSSRFVPTDAIMNVWFEWVVFVCGNAQSCKKHCDWVFGVLFVKCSKLQKKKKHCDWVFCVLFVEMLKAAKKQKKTLWLSVWCFVCGNAQSCKTKLQKKKKNIVIDDWVFCVLFVKMLKAVKPFSDCGLRKLVLTVLVVMRKKKNSWRFFCTHYCNEWKGTQKKKGAEIVALHNLFWLAIFQTISFSRSPKYRRTGNFYFFSCLDM
jgi:hypothetical protein